MSSIQFCSFFYEIVLMVTKWLKVQPDGNVTKEKFVSDWGIIAIRSLKHKIVMMRRRRLVLLSSPTSPMSWFGKSSKFVVLPAHWMVGIITALVIQLSCIAFALEKYSDPCFWLISSFMNLHWGRPVYKDVWKDQKSNSRRRLGDKLNARRYAHSFNYWLKRSRATIVYCVESDWGSKYKVRSFDVFWTLGPVPPFGQRT